MGNMAITQTGVSNGIGTTTTLTISHTVGAGNLQAVFFGVFFFGSPSSVSATYAGIAMTQIAVVNSLRVFQLVNPPLGTNNAVATCVSGATQSRGIVVSYSGVHQTNPNDTAVTGSGSGAGSDPSVSVSSAAGRVVVDFVYGTRTLSAAIGLSIGIGQTNIYTTPGFVSDSNDGTIAASSEPGAATNTMTWALSTTDAGTAWAQAAISINPAPDTSFFVMF